MKKTARKLVLRTETIREFSGQALSRVIGGQETPNDPQTGDKQCLTGVFIAALDGVARGRG